MSLYETSRYIYPSMYISNGGLYQDTEERTICLINLKEKAIDKTTYFLDSP